MLCMHVSKISFLTLRYGFHDVQKAHEETAGLCLVQLVTPRTVNYEGLRPCKLRRNTQTDTGNDILFVSMLFFNVSL